MHRGEKGSFQRKGLLLLKMRVVVTTHNKWPSSPELCLLSIQSLSVCTKASQRASWTFSEKARSSVVKDAHASDMLSQVMSHDDQNPRTGPYDLTLLIAELRKLWRESCGEISMHVARAKFGSSTATMSIADHIHHRLEGEDGR